MTGIQKTYNCSSCRKSVIPHIRGCFLKKKTGKEAYGFTMPLVLDVHGNKFGKSEGNALWLDINKTSSYELYQYLINHDPYKKEKFRKQHTHSTPSRPRGLFGVFLRFASVCGQRQVYLQIDKISNK